LLTPQDAVDFQRRNGLPEEPKWQIVVCQNAPNSRDPGVTGGGIQAALAYDNIDHLLNAPTEAIAKKLAMSIAGRAAHEALEWVRFDGELVVDPYGTPQELDEAAAYIREYLGNAAE